MKTAWFRFRLALLTSLCCVFVIATSARATSIVLDSQPGDFIGGGISQTFTPIDGVFSTTTGNGHVGITFHGNDFWDFDFASANGAPLVPGAYEGAIRYPFNDGHNGLDVSGAGRGSNTLTGRFDVLAANYGTDGSVQQFSVNFEQHSEGAPPALFGQVRYDINDATATPQQIRAATHIAPADLASLLPLTTKIADAPTGVFLMGEPGDFIVGNQTLTFLPPDARISVTGTKSSGVHVFLTEGVSHFWSLDFVTPQSLDFAAGDWGSATRFPFNSPTKPGLDVSGDGRGSNTLTGLFDVLQADFGPDGTIARFDAIFEQHSEGAPAAAFGRVRFNSTVSPVPEPSSITLLGLGTFVIIIVRIARRQQSIIRA